MYNNYQAKKRFYGGDWFRQEGIVQGAKHLVNLDRTLNFRGKINAENNSENNVVTFGGNNVAAVAA